MNRQNEWDKLVIAANENLKEKEYWLRQLAGASVNIGFPGDFQSLVDRSGGPECVEFKFSPQQCDILIKLRNNNDVRLNMILCAGVTALLRKTTNSLDIIVGMPIYKQETDIPFINTVVALRSRLRSGMSFKELLLDLRQTIDSAVEHQDYPIRVLAAQLNLPAQGNKFPLFDVMVLLENIHHRHYIRDIQTGMVFCFHREGECIQGRLEYDAQRFLPSTARRIVGHFLWFMEQALADVNLPITHIEIITPEEKKQVLEEFNNTTADYPENRTLHRLFSEQAEQTPGNTAVFGFSSAEEGYREITYRELNEKSSWLAGILRKKGITTDRIVGLLVPPCVEMVTGILGILKSGAAYLPIDSDYPQERSKYMLADSGADILVTVEGMQEIVEEINFKKEIVYLETLQNSIPVNANQLMSSTYAASLAYIIYTSGTTGKPKGVLVEHRNVVAYLAAFFRQFHITEKDTSIQLTSIAFDAFVEELYPVLLRGGKIGIPPANQGIDIEGLARFIKTYDVTMLNCTPLLLSQFNHLEIFDNLRIVISGGDVLKKEHVDQIVKRCCVYNTYGPTESTVCASYYPYTGSLPETVSNIPIGRPIANYTIYILDAYFNLLPVKVTGEICISGAGISRGYLNQPYLTAKNFLPPAARGALFEKTAPLDPPQKLLIKMFPVRMSNQKFLRGPGAVFIKRAPGRRRQGIYKTGDLGRWLEDGNIEFLGRIDRQVKIRGYRIETAEIEQQLLKHSKVKEALVIPGEDQETEKYLCAYLVPVRPGEIAGIPSWVKELREFLSLQLPGYMIPGYFMVLEQIPLTQSGKVDYQKLPEPTALTGQHAYSPPESSLEKKMVDIWADVLKIDKKIIGIHHNFFDLGGHSLRATVLISKIHKELGVKLSLIDLFKWSSIKELSRYIIYTLQHVMELASQDKYTNIDAVEKKEYYPMSSAQKRLYFLQQLDSASTAYNMPLVIHPGGDIDKDKIEMSLRKLIRRHESLRTSFHMIDSKPVQRIHGEVTFEIELLNQVPGVQSFDLSRAPLLRSALIRFPLLDRSYAWILDIHHIISDGTSHTLLGEDLMALLDSQTLPELRLQYKDFSEWQNRLFIGDEIKKQLDYWLEVYNGEIPRLELPTDYKRPEVFTFTGDIIEFELEPGKQDLQKLKKLGTRNNGTLYMSVLAALNVLFYKYTGQTDMIIGTGIADRPHVDLQQIIGMFVNTLAIRNFPNGEKTFEGFLSEVIDNSVKAFANQDVQFEDLVDQLELERDPARNPLFDITMVVQNFRHLGEGISAAHETQSPEQVSTSSFSNETQPQARYKNTSTKFDLTIYIFEDSDRVYLDVEYYTAIFKAETIKRMVNHLKRIIHAAVNQPAVKLRDIEIISSEEKEQVLFEFNDTARDFPAGKTIQELFAKQVERTPDNIALAGDRLVNRDRQEVDCGNEPLSTLTYITYNELDRQSQQLANYLFYVKRVQTEEPVGILMPPSIERPIAVIGVMKSGGVYVPIDPSFPLERIKYIINDAGIRIVISDENQANEFSRDVLVTVNKKNLIPERKNQSNNKYQGDLGILANMSSQPLDIPKSSHQAAYIIYTSGTTGKPRGVMINQQSLVNLCYWHKRYYGITAADHATLYAGFGFDASVWELFPYLITGSSLYVISDFLKLDPVRLNVFFERNHITVSFLPTQFYQQFSRHENRSLRLLLTGGDRLFTYTARSYDLYNNYGPTENTVVTTAYPVKNAGDLIPIGKPICNHCVYILNIEGTQLQPPNVPGELCISGVGLARGYLNQPGLTKKMFRLRRYSSDDTTNQKFLQGSRGRFLQKEPRGRRRQTIYKTGDLARWLSDGNIEFIGRIDQQVKIRGFRIEPAEIEVLLKKHRDIDDAVVLAREKKQGDQYLYAYIVAASDRKPEVSKLNDYLLTLLPGYMIPSYFVHIDRIPLTPSGKVDRKQLPEPVLQDSTGYTAPRNRLEEKLVEIWSEVLSIKQNVIGIHHNFFEIGGHSLKATILISIIHRQLNIKIPLAELFKHQTIQALAQYIKKAEEHKYHAIEPVEKKEYYELSSAQKRMYFLQKMDIDSIAYNIPLVLHLDNDFEKEKLEITLKQLIVRHESLRTSFHMLDQIPVQRVFQDVDFNIEIKTEAVTIDSFIRPFDLSKAPLLRSGLIRIAGNHHLWVIDIHHIVSDGTSHTILTGAFTDLYRGEELAPLRLQYKDFSHWQNKLFAGGGIKNQENYWKALYSGEIPRLDLPADFKRPPVFTFAGDNYDFRLEREDAKKFTNLAKTYGATLYMNILAILNTLFYKITGQSDIILGSGIAGRHHTDLQHIIGMFVNTLAVRNFPEGDKRFEDFLKEVIDNSINAFENQDVQFEDLVDKLELTRDPSRNPLFDVTMVVQNFRHLEKESELFTVAGDNQSDYINKTSKFDLTFFIWEQDEDIVINIEYYTAIFKAETIQRLSLFFKSIVKAVVNEPSIILKDIDIVSPQEKQRILYEFNEPSNMYPEDKSIYELFVEQVEKTPDSLAVIGMGTRFIGAGSEKCFLHITYRQLNETSGQLANYLFYGKSLQPQEPVGILMLRSVDMVASILGIYKAGGAYVPLDPGLPEERLKYMMDDTCTGTLISEKRFIRILNRLQWESEDFHSYLCLDTFDIQKEEETETGGHMSRELWHHIGETATDDITAGGWFSSFTGQPFSREEMDQYGDNVLKKLEPLLHPQARVLEIGVGSGITMFRIAPKVKLYYGTDFSAVIIERNRKIVEEKGYKNIKLAVLAAHEMNRLEENRFDIIIINSVIQAFPGHHYLRSIIKQCTGLLGDSGYLFIGDIMDLEKKDELVHELMSFKYADSSRNKNYTTKTDFSAELFVSKGFWEDLGAEWPEIRDIRFSSKIYTIENELTRFRYDTLMRIDKQCPGQPVKKWQKCKHQDDLKTVWAYQGKLFPLHLRSSSVDLAYIMYTSGSTGTPKGVMVEHRNVVRLIKNPNYINFSGRDKLLLTGRIAFDITTFEIWLPLLNGFTLCLAAEEVILDADQLAEFVAIHQVSILHLIPQLFNQHSSQRIDIFSGLKFFLVGGDLVQPIFINRLRNHNRDINILHMYGPTENTTFSTFHPVDRNYNSTIPIGKPVSHSSAYILNNSGQLQPIGIPGELCVGGSGISRGYLNKPQFTSERFTNYKSQMTNNGVSKLMSVEVNEQRNKKFLRGSRGQFFQKEPPGRRRQIIYKTGDLARWLEDGTIEFLGRIDSQVKIRGIRIEPGEIEARLLQYNQVKEAVVIDRLDDTGEKYLCAYLTCADTDMGTDTGSGIGAGPDTGELRDFLGLTLPDYMIPAFFINLGTLPYTSSGKIDRNSLVGLDIANLVAGEEYVAARDNLERQLQETWCEVLGKTKAEIGIDAQFFRVGGHSLKATVLTAKIQQTLNIKVPLSEIFNRPTIRELAEYIRSKGLEPGRYAAIDPVEKKDYYALSSAQKRMYFLQQMEENSTAYNMPMVIPLEGDLNVDWLEITFKKLLERHEGLRSSYEIVAGEPVQRVHDSDRLDFSLDIEPGTANENDYDNNNKDIFKDSNKNFVQPFDLSQAPLVRAGVLYSQDNRNILWVDVHHIVSDGTSHQVLLQDFNRLYNREQLNPLRLHYKDFSQWQNQWLASEEVRTQEDYWKETFAGEIPRINLPLDFIRPEQFTFAGNRSLFILGEEEAIKFRNLGTVNKATLYMNILAVINTLFYKYTGQSDMIIGCAVAGRHHADLQSVIGLFVNTLAMRNFPEGSKSYNYFLKEVSTNCINAFENENVQFETLVDMLDLPRDSSRNPLFDICMLVQNIGHDHQKTAEAGNDMFIPGQGRGAEPFIPGHVDKHKKYHKHDVSRFDISFSIYEAGDIIYFDIEYYTGIFKEETIKRLETHLGRIIKIVSDDPFICLKDIQLISLAERKQVLEEFNGPGRDYSQHKTIHEVFAHQVEELPDHLAVVFQGQAITYNELNQRANNLAGYLLAKGIRPGEAIAVMMRRSLEMVSVLLGILNAGACYLPININQPLLRREYILKDSGIRLLITDDSLIGEETGSGAVEVENILIIPGHEFSYEGKPRTRQLSPVISLAYIIYTSGSTGNPKGVMVEHRNVIPLVKEPGFISLGKRDRLLQTGALDFDISTFEIWGPLLNGAGLFVTDEETLLDGEQLGNQLLRYDISILHLIPQLFNRLADRYPGIFRGLTYLLIGGDLVKPLYVNKTKNEHHQLQILHMYGPTENTTFSTYLPVDKTWETALPIGKPLANSRVYIVGQDQELLPPGIVGEIWIGGDRLARGYLNKPQLAWEKFVNKKLLRGVQGGGFLEKSPPGRRRQLIYKTGDLGRWLVDGNIEFWGRKDHQVKVRGIRIELAEIENRVLAEEAIKEAVVADWRDKTGETYLCAYFTSRENVEPAQLRETLSLKLPAPMIPSYFVQLERMPLTASGKIDRKALPPPEIKFSHDYVAPANETEEALVDIWSEVLGIPGEAVGVETGFFDLGGHSLSLIKMKARIKEIFDRDLAAAKLFQLPTIRALAAHIRDENIDMRTPEEILKESTQAMESTLRIIEEFNHE